MLKKINVFIIVIICTLSIFVIFIQKNYALQTQRCPKEVLYKDFLLSQLIPYISEGIKDYYGADKSYDLHDAKVISIKRLEKGSYYFEIKIQVTTYSGAHNPPYGIDNVTIRQDVSGIYVSDYEHLKYTRSKIVAPTWSNANNLQINLR